MNIDETYMSRCLQLASLGAGAVAPNPMVGAVLVCQDKIIGEGYHQKYGDAHAEVNCLNSVEEKNRPFISASTLYVSLEPCAHYGKTPPCADLIIKNKISKVVIGCRDIYKEVDGRGIEKLQNAGIEVEVGVWENECRELNKRFFTFHQKKRPYIILKWAQSANAKIGLAGKRILISNEYTNRLVHKWRSEEAAIMVGTNTALNDDPSLTTRLWKGKNPLRVVVDMELKLPAHLQIFNADAATIIFNQVKNDEVKNIRYYKIDRENLLVQMMDTLYKMNVQSVLVEGGAKLLQSFIDKGLWDQERVITSNTLFVDDGISAPILKNSLLNNHETHQNDSVFYYLINQ